MVGIVVGVGGPVLVLKGAGKSEETLEKSQEFQGLH